MQDPKAKSDMIRLSVLSSSAVEGIYVDLPENINKSDAKSTKSHKIH